MLHRVPREHRTVRTFAYVEARHIRMATRGNVHVTNVLTWRDSRAKPESARSISFLSPIMFSRQLQLGLKISISRAAIFQMGTTTRTDDKGTSILLNWFLSIEWVCVERLDPSISDWVSPNEFPPKVCTYAYFMCFCRVSMFGILKVGSQICSF